MRLVGFFSWLLSTLIILAACAGGPSTPDDVPTRAATATALAAPATAARPAPTAVAAPQFARTACAAGVDLTGQTLTLYHLVDPQSQLVQPMMAGLQDAAAYFNNQGGICGASLVQEFPDPAQAYDPVVEFKRLLTLSPRPVMLTVSDSGAAEQLRDSLATDQIPALGLRLGGLAGLYGLDGRTPGWIFGMSPTYPDQLAAFCRYVSEHPQQFPQPVIGDLSWETGGTGQPIHTPEVIAYCASQGVRVLDLDLYFAGTSTDVYPLVQKLIDAGANILYTNSYGNGPALIAKTLADRKIQDTVALATMNWGLDSSPALLGQTTLELNGLPELNGMLGSLPLRTLSESDQPGIELITQQADLRQRPLSLRSNFYILGWASTDLYIEVYIRTGNRVGFDHVTGAELKKTLETIVYSPLGGLETIDYQGGTRRAPAADRLGQIEYLGRDGKNPAGPNNPPLLVNEAGQQLMVPILVPLSDFQPAPDMRPSGAAQLTETAPTAAPIIAAGPRIAYQTVAAMNDASEVWVINADGSGLRRLTNNQYADVMPSWSPDGQKIAFVSDRVNNSNDIFLMNPDGSGVTRLTTDPADDQQPRWSPDGQKILFISDRDAVGSTHEIYLMNADGSQQTRLTNNSYEDGFASWSPDGKRILYWANPGGKNGLYLMNADGSSQTLVTDVSVVGDWSAWSPDGQQIVFVSNRDGHSELYVMHADGSQVTRLTHNPANQGAPAWSPDGKQIAFNSDRSGVEQVFLMKADGSGQTQLTTNPEGALWPSWMR